MRQQDDFDVESFWDGCKLRSFPARTQWVLLWEPYKTGEWGQFCVFLICMCLRVDEQFWKGVEDGKGVGRENGLDGRRVLGIGCCAM